MNLAEAQTLLAELSTENTTVRQMGTVRIIDEDNNTKTIEATYAVADVLRLLDKGLAPRVALSILDRTD